MRRTSNRPEIVLSTEELPEELRRRSRRGFLVGGLAAAAAIGGYEWLTKAGQEDGVPWPQRRVLDVNQRLAQSYLSNGHLMPTYAPVR